MIIAIEQGSPFHRSHNQRQGVNLLFSQTASPSFLREPIILSYGRVVSEPEPRDFSVFHLKVASIMKLMPDWWADFPQTFELASLVKSLEPNSLK